MRDEVAQLTRRPNEAMPFASHAASTVSFGAQLHWNVDNACGRCRFNWIPGSRAMEFDALILDDLGPGLALGVGGKARQDRTGQDSAQLTEPARPIARDHKFRADGRLFREAHQSQLKRLKQLNWGG
jgi:hypothetical protein